MKDDCLLKETENGFVECYIEGSIAPIFISNQDTIESWKNCSGENYFLVKDNFWTNELPTTAASLFLREFFPGQDATVIKLLKKSGYHLLGKSNLDEFACGGTGLFSSGGLISNPHSELNLVGGSSSGSAFAVARDIVPFALGHDTGDSVRRPAAYCGVIGFKPSYGLISRYGVIPMASSFDTVGILSKQINLVKDVFKIIAQPDYHDLITIESSKINCEENKFKRIAIIKGIEEFLDTEYLAAYNKVIDVLRGSSEYSVEFVEIPNEIRESLQITYLIICSSELVSHLGSLQGITYGNRESLGKSVLERRTDFIGKWVKERVLFGTYFLEQEGLLEKAQKMRSAVKQWSDELFKKFGFLMFPGTIGPAPSIEELFGDYNMRNSHWSDNLMLIANLTGNTSINIPIGTSNGLPISINIDSSWKNDNQLLDFTELVLKKIN